MTPEIKEQISAYIDGELSEEEAALLVRRLGGDASLRAYAAELMQISQMMRGERSAADAGFAAGVMAALDQEPVLADAPEETTVTPTVDETTDGGGGWFRMVAGGGIAAAVAVAVLVSLPGGQPLAPATTPAAAPVAVVAPTAMESQQAASVEEFEYVVPASVTDAGLVSADPELAAYYLSHSASAPSLAPGNGRVRMLTSSDRDDSMPDDDLESDSVDDDLEPSLNGGLR